MTKKKIAMSFLVITFIFVCAFLISSFFWKAININGRNFVAELSRTPGDYKKGLGGRNSLCSHCAMLFIFPQRGMYTFWMKDMRFDLDIIWIADGKIVYIKKDFAASSVETVAPGVAADSVLEIGAGLSEKYKFEIGDSVSVY